MEILNLFSVHPIFFLTGNVRLGAKMSVGCENG